MADLALKTAIGNYGHTQPLKDGSVTSPRVSLEQEEVSNVVAVFRRMIRGLEFDVSEMALSTYLCARAHGKPITAIPVFLVRGFHHGAILYNTRSGIASPKDLEGRKVGVRGYTVTTGVWVRGILQSSYGVDPSKVTWVLWGDEHVQEYQAPPNVVPAPGGKDVAEMLVSGEVDAAIGVGAVDSPDVKPLIPDARNAAIDFYRQTGVYPINHTLVVRNEHLQAHPWLAQDLFGLFHQAKDHYLARLRAQGPKSPQDENIMGLISAVGEDPFWYGLEPNRKTLEAFIGYNVAQKVIPRAIAPEDMFDASTVG